MQEESLRVQDRGVQVLAHGRETSFRDQVPLISRFATYCRAMLGGIASHVQSRAPSDKISVNSAPGLRMHSVYIHTYVRTCTYVHACLTAYILLCIHAYMHAHVHAHACIYFCIYIYTCMCMYVCLCVCR